MVKITSYFIILLNILSRSLFLTFNYVRNKLNMMSLKGYLLRKNVSFYDDIILLGGIKLNINKKSNVSIGKSVICLGHGYTTECGLYSKIVVEKNASLRIGDKTGMSTCSLYCSKEISIGNCVKIGAGCKIMDTNFHALKWEERLDKSSDKKNRKCLPICIKDNVFIGTRCIICKGVTIGANSIIAAGSVVVKDIPANCIAGGNPCKVIKFIE